MGVRSQNSEVRILDCLPVRCLPERLPERCSPACAVHADRQTGRQADRRALAVRHADRWTVFEL
ncbi:hypothetical protein B9J77_02425 [candidate division NPL-UPA2 bacterium Unc8]|uniref:Uncharacterized protein n=1 Tax=candidate division NPL-UPA2 bacterium Unc8 TaxID=1980939 RepID=A0A399FYZ8_UNCN2|nr:MAG: hypothetical protein B9J77_02425 [candidate division NPL-UPA2 bacterium Unc8]